MPRKNQKEYTTIEMEKKVLKILDKKKIHPNQSYSEVIKELLNASSKNNKI